MDVRDLGDSSSARGDLQLHNRLSESRSPYVSSDTASSRASAC